MRRREGRDYQRDPEFSKKAENPDDSGVTVSKARGVMGLIALLFVFQCATFVIHKCDSGNSHKTGLWKTDPDKTGCSETDINGFFDPNTVSAESLTIFGLTERQALAIIRYREKGGKFQRTEDFGKMYVIDERLFERVAPHIRIAEQRKEDYRSKKNPAVQPRSEKLQAAGKRIEERSPDAEMQPGKHDSATAPASEAAAGVYGGSDKEADKEIGTGTEIKTGTGVVSPYAVDLNEADSTALVAIRGIGPYFASGILRLRARLGSYASVEQLADVRGMTPERLAPLRRYLFVHPGGIKKFSLASADYEFMRRHPYIGPYRARGIALFREEHGEKECSLENLVANSILDTETAGKLAPYIEAADEK